MERTSVFRASVEVPALAWLISPIEIADFRANYFERKPLLVKREDPGYYAELMTMEDLDDVFATSNFRADNTRIIVDGRETPVSELGEAPGSELEKLYSYYRDGHTIIINGIQERWTPLARLCRRLNLEANLHAQVNVYLTPPNARGFKAHYDTHDVLMAQAYGSKTWRLYGADADLPLPTQRCDKSKDFGRPRTEFSLSDGDVVYLPRGTVHEGTSTGEASMHITVGLHPPVWAASIKRAVEAIVENDIEFRKVMPLGFAHDAEVRTEAEQIAKFLADRLRDQMSPEDIVSRSAREAVVNHRTPDLHGHLLDLQRLDDVDLDTTVRRRSETQMMLTVDESIARLAFHGKTVELPVHVVPELRYIAETSQAGFTARSIAGDLDVAGCLVLVRMLFREGLLTTC
ncbi:cupin domain-containing protein [Actinomadura rupiterrae]|uniref:cupin domain-containing protein n=1 Tax=Actinomadura rupiterrae TaxID=559627 RepID=UPI0020A393C9|nr:cupin domain-containing protein [Actinomadura rupiterrae]MCP2343171.1 ribosomal protein L16 Arg81 hydroxylase [Actinomadura rupiterrae]